ncbi:hypothetical protein AURDEDRAFT_160723 [Auricularia subglabra TFB-10046 SS5]|nr:hypothetical protein AURDEDRAFT_160723 [Auricularia subglabra TFB-10046 SS5]
MSHLRLVAFWNPGDARLWSHIATSSGARNSSLRHFLERGESVPVSLDIDIRKERQNDLVELLAVHISRMRRIVLSSPLYDADFVPLGLIPAGFARPAPCLRYFELRLGWEIGLYIQFEKAFFAGHTPALEQLWLDIPFHPVLRAFTSLRVVVLICPRSHTFQHIWHVLYSCPALEHAAIRAARSSDDQLPDGPLPVLPALRSLRFRIDYELEGITHGAAAAMLCSALRPEVLSRIDLVIMPVVLRNDLLVGADYIFVGQQSQKWQKFNIHTRGAHRPSRTFRAAGARPSREVLHHQLVFSAGCLQELTVSTSLLISIALPDGVEFPRLHTYTLSLHERDAIFAEQGARMYLERMPALAALVLRRERASKGPPQDVLVDSNSLRSCLTVRRPGLCQIARLILQGVEARMTSTDVQPFVGELLCEPWESIDQPVIERMDQWLFDDARL